MDVGYVGKFNPMQEVTWFKVQLVAKDSTPLEYAAAGSQGVEITDNGKPFTGQLSKGKHELVFIVTTRNQLPALMVQHSSQFSIVSCQSSLDGKTWMPVETDSRYNDPEVNPNVRINDEVLLVVALGLCCAMAVFSSKVGFSSAFGAFIMGSILAETVEAEHIEHLVEPVKNLFGAIFFVSVGMLVDPEILISYALPIAVLVLTIIVGQAVLGTLSFMLGGESLKSAMRCGFSMAQIGEFSFIIASLGLSLGVIGDFLYPVVVAVSVITTFLTPYMIRLATPVYNLVEPRLPTKVIRALNHLSTSRPETTERSKWRQLLVQMGWNTLVYGILTMATIAVMFMFVHPLLLPIDSLLDVDFLSHRLSLAGIITGLLTLVFISPFLRAMVMKKNRSEEFRALWAESNRNRLPLLFTILARFMLAVGFVFGVVQHVAHFRPAVIIMVCIAVIVGIIFSRKIKKRSILLERLFINNLHSRDINAQLQGDRRPLYEDRLLDRDVHIADFRVPSLSLWPGHTLKQLDLGRKYGVHVSSILREGRRLNIPDGDSIIFPQDKLQVIGSDSQLEQLRKAIETEVMADDYAPESHEMKLRQLIIAADSPFVGKTLQESGIRSRYGCMVVGLEEGKENLSPVNTQYRFREGDIIWVVGEQKALNSLT